MHANLWHFARVSVIFGVLYNIIRNTTVYQSLVGSRCVDAHRSRRPM